MRKRILTLNELFVFTSIVLAGFSLSGDSYNSTEIFVVVFHMWFGILVSNCIGDEYDRHFRKSAKRRDCIYFISYSLTIISYIMVFSLMYFSCETLREYYVNTGQAKLVGATLGIFYMFIEHLSMWIMNLKDLPRYHITKTLFFVPDMASLSTSKERKRYK